MFVVLISTKAAYYYVFTMSILLLSNLGDFLVENESSTYFWVLKHKGSRSSAAGEALSYDPNRGSYKRRIAGDYDTLR